MTKIYKRQPPEKVIAGITMKYNMKFNVWVNLEGTRAYREYTKSEWNRFLQIHTNVDGSKYLDVHPQSIHLDEVVAGCFNPMPEDGKEYKLIHKDGNLGNCHAYNLEWKEPVSSLAGRIASVGQPQKLDNGLTVTFKGEIYEKGKKKLPVISSLYDADTEREVAIEPQVRFQMKNAYGRRIEKRVPVDDLMAKAGFVDGDKSSLIAPGVLHKNMDYLDFHADNLEWVEESSPQYQEYMKKKREDMDKQTIRLNPNHPNPLMLPKN